MRLKHGAMAAGAVLVAASLAFVQGPGILFPNWSAPTKGSYNAPAGEIGKPVSPQTHWSATTVGAAIDGKPLQGQPITVVGEVIDLSCYLQVGKHGDKHRDCGQKCARAGQPIGLLASDGTVYAVIDEEHDPRRDGQTTLRATLTDHMADVVTVHGTATEVAGQKAIFVQGSVKTN